MTIFHHSGECAYDSTRSTARQNTHAHAAAVATSRYWRQANRIGLALGGVDEITSKGQGDAVNMPVIISNRAQQNGTLRGYPILDFKEVSSHEGHEAWLRWLDIQSRYSCGKPSPKKNYERRYS